MAFDGWLARRRALSATKTALLLPKCCAYHDRFSRLKATRHIFTQSIAHARLSLFDFGVVEEPFIDGAIGSVVFDGDVLYTLILWHLLSLVGLCSLQPPPAP